MSFVPISLSLSPSLCIMFSTSTQVLLHQDVACTSAPTTSSPTLSTLHSSSYYYLQIHHVHMQCCTSRFHSLRSVFSPWPKIFTTTSRPLLLTFLSVGNGYRRCLRNWHTSHMSMLSLSVNFESPMMTPLDCMFRSF